MTGGPGMGAESFTNYGTGAAGTPGSSAHDADRSPAPRGGVGSAAVLVVAVILLLAFLAAVLLL